MNFFMQRSELRNLYDKVAVGEAFDPRGGLALLKLVGQALKKIAVATALSKSQATFHKAAAN
ncbi:MAG: hypothetical protein U1F83_18640 [Verrucomicrobiota bacterium]